MLGLDSDSLPSCMSLSFFEIKINNKKLFGGEDAEILFFLLIAFQIFHVFLRDISVHCALPEYPYI
jgi:hypothetical protein